MHVLTASEINKLPGVKRVEVIGGQTLIEADCREVMQDLGRFNACLTDPPYGIGEHGGKKRFGPASIARGFASNKEYSRKTWDASPASEAAISAAITSSDKSVIWGANHFITRIAMDSPCWLVWHKKGADRSSFADCELAWTNLSGAVRYFKLDWVGFGAINSGEVRLHPTQKPVALMEWCLGFLPNAQTVIDPFMGSGTTLVACQRLGRMGTGIEVDPDYFEVACRRVEEATRQPDLFVAPPDQPQQEPLI